MFDSSANTMNLAFESPSFTHRKNHNEEWLRSKENARIIAGKPHEDP
jgi:hypothetical protein